MVSDFSTVQQAIEDGISRQLHSCVQIYVSLKGRVVLNEGFGAANSETVCDQKTAMLWRSAGKPVTAAAICKAWQHGLLSLDTRLVQLLPDAKGAIGDITIKQLLTHQSGLPIIETGWPMSEWSGILQKVLSLTPSITEAAYQPQSTWFLLGEILQRIDSKQRAFADIIKEDLLLPLGMADSSCGVSQEHASGLSLPTYYLRQRGQLVEADFGEGRWLTQPSPGGNFRGPVSDLGRFYEMMLAAGVASDGRPFLSQQTVAAMTAAHRRSRFDQTLQHVIDMGLGVLVDSNIHGASTVPYGFSQFSSPESFGHGGSQCAMGFCDPVHELVVAWAANGFCGEGQHQRRNTAINEAVYQDLGLA